MAANSLALESSCQIEFAKKDGFVCRCCLQPARILASDCDNANLFQLPLTSKTLVLPCHIKAKGFNDPAHTLEEKSLAKLEVLQASWAKGDAVGHVVEHIRRFRGGTGRCSPPHGIGRHISGLRGAGPADKP